MLPLMTMDATLEEIQFSKANGACGLFTRGLVDNKLLSDPYFFPLYEEAGRLGPPVAYTRPPVISIGLICFKGKADFPNSNFPS